MCPAPALSCTPTSLAEPQPSSVQGLGWSTPASGSHPESSVCPITFTHLRRSHGLPLARHRLQSQVSTSVPTDSKFLECRGSRFHRAPSP